MDPDETLHLDLPHGEPLGLGHMVGHQAAVTWLTRLVARDRLPHGLLFLGPRGVGKRTLALTLVGQHFCATRVGCGTCGPCASLHRGNLPGLVQVEATGVGSLIGISQIKELQATLALSAPDERGRLCIIQGADQLTPEAQDAFLKTLEEPPPGNILILTTSRADALLPTIRSRCQRLNLTGLSEAELSQVAARLGLEVTVPWAMALGCPGRLRELCDPLVARLRQGLLKLLGAERGPGDLARLTYLLDEAVPTKSGSGKGKGKGKASKPSSSEVRDGAHLLLRLLGALIRDLVVLHVTPETADLRNVDFRDQLLPLARRPEWSSGGNWLERLARCRDQIAGFVNPAAALVGLLFPVEPHLAHLGELTQP